ncbi:hypothetical protein Fmac_014790 [Flemingia macrophylla]|uniref:Uncharacterized protein n=1 Tax=Flemingia macrophylla TaxID=520843 RepID=A0ABD1MCV9_9FABA
MARTAQVIYQYGDDQNTFTVDDYGFRDGKNDAFEGEERCLQRGKNVASKMDKMASIGQTKGSGRETLQGEERGYKGRRGRGSHGLVALVVMKTRKWMRGIDKD